MNRLRRLGVQFGFRLLYNELAVSYDAVSWIVSLGEWRSWQRAALPHLGVASGGRVLELAHGTANLQIDLRALGYDTIGCDVSRAMGRIASHKLRRVGLTPQLIRARAQGLPFGAEQFAAIVCTFPTEFIVDPATIVEIYRVLRPNGRLVFVPSALFTGRGAAQRSLEGAYRVTGQRGGWSSEVLARFTASGFRLTQSAEPCKMSVAYVVIAQKSA